jgi:hypothetical protein
MLSRAMTIAEHAPAAVAAVAAAASVPLAALASIAEGVSAVSPGADSARKRPALMRAISLAHPEEVQFRQ